MPLSFFTNSGNSYGSAIPFQRIVEPAQLGMFLNLEQAELLRIQRYNEHWRFYFGKHWIFDREDGEPLVTLNYARLIVDKSVSWLVKNGFEIDVPDALEHVVGPFLEEVWHYNLRGQYLYDAATMGAVTGDVFTLVTYEEPTEQARRANPNSQGAIKIQLLGSEQAFPSWDPLDVDVLSAMRIETLYYDDRNQLSRTDRDDKANHQGRQLYVKKFTQILTPEEIIEQYEGGTPVRRPNLLGEIPIVHTRNLPLPREFYGLSDLDGIIDLQRELNEKSTDVSDIIAYHASPVTVIKGAKASQLERGARQIWSGLPSDSDVFNLKLDGDLSASYEYLNYIKRSLLEIAEIPQAMLDTQAPSNTSGAALAMQYQPIVDKTKRKLPHYEAGIARINYLILRISAALGMLHLPFDLCKTCGGRIVEVLDQTGPFPRTVRKCYRIDKNDFSFLLPEQIKVPHVRQHSFGTETRESPMGQVREEHKELHPSAWDPETQEGQMARERRQEHQGDSQRQEDDRADEDQKRAQEPPQEGPDGQSKPKPKKVGWKSRQTVSKDEKDLATPQAGGRVKLPDEPEPVMLSKIWIHPTTGERVRIDRQMLLLTPCGCDHPQYLDPFSTDVRFLDSLPRDIHLDAQLHQQLLGMQLVSRDWVRRHTKPIAKEEIRKIKEEMEEERREGAEQMQQKDGEDDSLAAPQSEVQGMELQRKLGSIGGKISKPPKKGEGDKEATP